MRAVAAAVALGLLAGCDSAEERAKGHFENAVKFLEAGQTGKARVELLNVLKLDNEHVEAHLAFGKLKEDQGRLHRAVRHYIRVIDLQEDNWEAHLRYGRLMLASDNMDEALRASNTAFELAPENAEVLALRATVAYRLGNIKTAEEALNAAFERDDSLTQLWILRAAMYRDAGDFKSAIAAAESGLAIEPANIPLGLARVGLLSADGRPDDSVAALADLVERNPDNVGLRETLLQSEIARRDYEAAEASLRKLAELEPDRTGRALDVVRFVYRLEGVEAGVAELDSRIGAASDARKAWPFTRAKIALFYDEERDEAAEQLLQDAISEIGTGSEAHEARVMLARQRLVAGDRAAGEALIDEVLAADDTNDGALVLRARLQLNDRQYDAAIETLRKATNANRDSVEALQLLGTAHRLNGNRQLAGERIADAARVSGYAAGPTLAYVQHLLREGKGDFATGVVEDALRENPRDRRLLEALAELRLRRGDYVGAEEVALTLARLGADPMSGERIIAAARFGRNDFDTSIGILERHFAQNPVDMSLTRMVQAYVRAERLDTARSLIDETLAENPENAEALRIKAAFLAQDGDVDGGRRLLRRAISADETATASYAALASLETRLGAPEEGLATLEQGIAATDSDGLRMNAAILREQLGDIEGAVALYRIVYDRQPTFDIAANNLASLLSDHDPTPEALEEALVAAKRLRGSNRPEFQDTYAWLLHLNGESATALPVMRSAAAGLPQHPVVRYHLAAVQAANGLATEAMESARLALELFDGADVAQRHATEALIAELRTAAAGAATE